jgi:hypothetical protein
MLGEWLLNTHTTVNGHVMPAVLTIGTHTESLCVRKYMMSKPKIKQFIDDGVNSINPYANNRKLDHVIYNYGFLLGVLTDILYDDSKLRVEFMKRIEQLRTNKANK